MLVEGVEFGANGIGIGVVEVGEDVHGVLPGSVGGGEVVGGVVRISKVSQRSRFTVAVAELSVQAERVLVAGDGLVVQAEVVGVAERVPDVSLSVTVAEFLVTVRACRQ